MSYKYGNIFDHMISGILVHGCNYQCKMEKGFAKDFKNKYPKAYMKYVDDIQTGQISVGDISWSYTPLLYLASGITQEFYGSDGEKYVSYDAVDSVMNKVFDLAARQKMPVHMPKIGAGLGGGNWDIISSIVLVNAEKHGVDSNKIFIWEL